MMQTLLVTAADGRQLSLEEFRAAYQSDMKNPAQLSLRYRRTIDLIARETGESGRWLDYGAGWGDFGWHLAQRLPGWQVVGLDGDDTCHAIASTLFPRDNLKFLKADYGDIAPVAGEIWDGISLLEVLEHTKEPVVLIEQCRKLLKPGGLLVLSTPNAFGWRYVDHEWRRRLNRMLGRRDMPGYLAMLRATPYDPVTERGHITTYTAELLERLLRVCGFDVQTLEFVPVTGKIAHRLFPDTLLVSAKRRDQP